jgi:hypothetical protein
LQKLKKNEDSMSDILGIFIIGVIIIIFASCKLVDFIFWCFKEKEPPVEFEGNWFRLNEEDEDNNNNED